VWCWGENLKGVLGVTNETAPSSVYAKKIDLAPATSVVSGDGFSCARLVSGEIRCWGRNDYGQLGIGSTDTNENPIPQVVSSAASGATLLTAGKKHVCAVVNSSMMCWGYGIDGQLGNGSYTNQATPVPITVGGTPTSISANSTHTCAVLSTGSVKCWGKNTFGQLGNGNKIDASTAASVSGISTATAVVTGETSTCALLTPSYNVYCWGNALEGRLGSVQGADQTSPIAVSSIVDPVAKIAASDDSFCAKTSGNNLYCWGKNQYGTVGNATATATTVPVSIASGTNSVFMGNFGTCRIPVTSGLQVQCWGKNTYGELGNGSSGGFVTTPSDNLSFISP
jgi:alpha-tubulin suppressor-like RCC1 family protein